MSPLRLSAVQTSYCVDETRIFSAGFSEHAIPSFGSSAIAAFFKQF